MRKWADDWAREFFRTLAQSTGKRHSILARAVFWTKAKGSGGVLADGKGLHAIQHGSAAGADSNDPLWLPLGGTQYLYLPGSSGNYASAPDSAALSVTGDLDLQVRCALDDWTPTSGQTLLAKTSGTTSYRFLVAATGVLQLFLSADGSTVLSTSSSAAPVVADGTTLWVRVTWRQSDKRVQFFTSSDGSAWTQLGTDQTLNVAAIFDNAAAVEIGSLAAGTASLAAGKFYRARIYSGFSDAGGTLVFDANFANATEPFATFTESSTNAATVTINRSTSGRKSTVVDRDCYLLGTDDYFEIADAADLNLADGDALTVAILVRRPGASASQSWISKRLAPGTANVGWHILQLATGVTELLTGDGSVERVTANAGAFPSNVLTLAAATQTAADATAIYNDATVAVGGGLAVGSLVNSQPLRIGADAGGSRFADMQFLGAAVFREALSAADLARVKQELLA